MHSKTAAVLLLLCVCFLTINDSYGYKILGVFPFFSPSHFFLGNELIKGLAEAGHDVTMLTVFEEKNPPKNGKYRQIVMDDLREFQKVLFAPLANLSRHQNQSFFSNPFKMMINFHFMNQEISEKLLSNAKTQQLMKSGERFDVVIIPQFFLEATKGFAAHFGAHLVLFNNNAANSWMNHFVGNPTLPSLQPELVLGYTGRMTFRQRLSNTLFRIVKYIADHAFSYPSENDLLHKYISKDMDLTAIQYNVSLVLSNSHPSLTPAAPSVPCMKEIGGFHVKPPKKLPEELQKYLDDAKDGAIYFSMGSNLKGADLPPEFRSALMKAFSKRKEKVLWKFEADDMPGKPKNVMIQKWLPQSDILAHPNVRLFITHGGFLSTIETVYHGVPTLAIPILGDQLTNARLAEKDGYAKALEFTSLTEETVSSALDEVLSNKKYLENAKYISKIFHDRQIKPIDEAVYWIEYIVKYNGAKHLKVDYLDLTWYQYFMLDVFGLIFSVIFLGLFVLKKILGAVLSLCTSKSSKPGSKKVKKN